MREKIQELKNDYEKHIGLRKHLANAFITNAEANDTDLDVFIITLIELAGLLYNGEWKDPQPEKFGAFAAEILNDIQHKKMLMATQSQGSC